MSLLVPMLLLCFGQPIEEPTTLPTTRAEVQPTESLVSAEEFTSGRASQTMPTANDQRPFAGNVCYTMRSYIFERRDSLAPELLGMTTCLPAKAIGQKRVAGKARLVPAK